MRLTRAELAAWIEEGCDPDRAEEIAAAVATSPRLQQLVAGLRARIAEDDPPGDGDAGPALEAA